MTKRLFAILLCAIMTVAMLAGCGNSTAPTQAPAQTSAAANQSEPPAPQSAQKKQVTINWGTQFNGDPNEDDLGEWMQSNFKVTIVAVAIDKEDKLKTLAASGTLPDLIGGMAIGDATFNTLKTDGMIRDIPDDMLAKYPLLKKTIDEHPLLTAVKASVGKNYWLPIYGDADKVYTAEKSPFYIRADWLQKLNLQMPKTVDDLYNVLKAFTFNDPDGDGKNDTYGISGWLWQVHFLPWVDMYSWMKEDDKWIPGFMSKKMLDGLKFYNKLYLDGILDPEFAAANRNPSNMFITDKIGCMNGNGESYWIWRNIYKSFSGVKHGEKQYTVDEAMQAVQFLQPLAVNAGTPAQWAPQLDCYGFAVSAKSSDDVLDRLLDIANWELTPEGRDFFTYGFKDKDWIVKDNKAISILPNNPATGTQKNLSQVYPCLTGLEISENFSVAGTPWLNPTLPQQCLDRADQYEATAAPFVLKENFVIDNLSTPLKDKCSIAPPGACEADFENLIASKNIEADYNALIKSYLDSKGLQAAIDEVNQVITQQGLDK